MDCINTINSNKFVPQIFLTLRLKFNINTNQMDIFFFLSLSIFHVVLFFFFFISSIIIGQCQEEFYWRLMQFQKRISRFGWETVNTSNYDNELHFPKKNIGYKSSREDDGNCTRSEKILKIPNARCRKVRMRREIFQVEKFLRDNFSNGEFFFFQYNYSFNSWDVINLSNKVI